MPVITICQQQKLKELVFCQPWSQDYTTVGGMIKCASLYKTEEVLHRPIRTNKNGNVA